MEDFRKLSNGVLEIQNLKEQTKALNAHKKSALEELGTIVYTNISQGLSEEKKVKEMCDLLKAIDNQIKEKEGEILRISDEVKESILRLRPIAPCDCGTELYEGIKFCYQCGNVLDRYEHEKQITNLNTYLNVSSMIAQALDLRDVLEAVLYFCMESFGVEAASLLLLDYEKQNFRFYSAEGPAKPVLLMASFPSTHVLAGAGLASQQSEFINDVQNDPRFFKRFDQESGFVTRNMIVVPLTAGEEKIGVLQILNKFDGDFLDEELLFLQTIAEEIAYAIRRAGRGEVLSPQGQSAARKRGAAGHWRS